MQNIREEFPDINESVIGAVIQVAGKDQNKAASILRDMEKQNKKEREDKILELKDQFSSLSVEDIKVILESVNWDVDQAIVPLLTKTEEIKASERKHTESFETSKRSEEDKKKRRSELDRATTQLLEIFRTIPKDIIHEILEKNEGETDATMEELFRIVKKQEDEAQEKMKQKQAQERRESESRDKIMIQALKGKFPDLAENIIVQVLNQHQKDVKKACLNLTAIADQMKIQDLQSHFPTLALEQIQAALDQNNWDKLKAATNLTNLLKSKQEKATTQEKKVEPTIIKKVQDNLLERSTILGVEVEDQVRRKQKDAEEKQHKEQLEAFKQGLSHILETQTRHGISPGMPAPLPKEIDQRLGKKRPVEEETKPLDSFDTPDELKPDGPHVTDAVAVDSSKVSVTLKATPDRVDCNNTITLSYSILGQSTAWDWVGLYSVGKQNKQYITYQYRGKSETADQLTFKAPAEFGEYEFRYFSGSYESLARSSTIVVGPQIDLIASISQDTNKFKVKWSQKSGNAYSRAWIGLYEKAEKNNKQFLHWEYAGSPDTELSFDGFVKPVEYEFRFFPYSYEHLATSNTIQVEGSDTIEVEVSPEGVMKVKTNLVSINPYYASAWLGLFLVSESNNRQWIKFKYVKERTSQTPFRPPSKLSSEMYQFRLFAEGTYEPLLSSAPFSLNQ